MGNTGSSHHPFTNDRSGGTSIGLPLPVRDSNLFKHSASEYILNFLSDNPTINVSIRQLSEVTPNSERATREAVDTLETNGLVETFHKGNARRVHINTAHLDSATDPITRIPQTQFQTPIRVARRYIEAELDSVVGIVLYGSVARGTGDRRSDIDIWILVTDDHMQQRHEANKLAQKLSNLAIPSTIPVAETTAADVEENWSDIRDKLETDGQTWPSAERYSFEFVVETPQSIVAQSDRVDAEKLFGQGITLLDSETLDRVIQEVLSGE